MTEQDRKAWVGVARETLKGIPADLMLRGCDAARRKCRFASEIVPTIIETVGRTWDHRKQDAARLSAPRLPKPEQPEYVSAEAVRKLIGSIGRA